MQRRFVMKPFRHVIPCLFTLAVLAGCASTKVTDREIYVMDNIPRPDHILVYNFAATPSDMPINSPLKGELSAGSASQTSEEIAAGRQLGVQIATNLVKRIRDMGLQAQLATRLTRLQVNDILLVGYLLSVEEGSGAKRVAIGFRQGVAELKTAVEGFQATSQGLRKLGFGAVNSAGSKTPGAAVPTAVMLVTGSPVGLIVSGTMKVAGEVTGRNTIEGRADETAKEIAQVLKQRFEQLGWIK